MPEPTSSTVPNAPPTGGNAVPRLLLLTSHAIQYQAPLLRAMAKDPRFRMHVALCSDFGATAYRDKGFGQEVKWDVPLLEGYDFEVLRNFSPIPSPSGVFGLINPGIMSRIWSGKYDVLMLHAWISVTTWMAIFAATLVGIPIIIKPEANIHSRRKTWLSGVKRVILSTVFRRIRIVLASGKYGVEYFRHHNVPDHKIVVAPYAIDNDFFLGKEETLRPQRAELRRKLGIEANVPVIIFVGKLYPGKRPLDLLQAFAAVRKKSAAALLFVGDGESRIAMEDWVQRENVRDVHFAGFRNQTELPGFLTAADIFVLPSALETWGLVVNEAMCFALPVIVTDKVGAGGDLVLPNINGFVYPVGDVQQLATYLSQLVDDPNLRQSMGAESLAIIKKWSFREDLDVIASVVRQLIPAAPFPK